MFAVCVLQTHLLFVVFFFFSSRRRHTRSLRDWSSDVCSSDLGSEERMPCPLSGSISCAASRPVTARRSARSSTRRCARSEERRVGKECRSRGAPYHQKKKEKDIE